MASCATSAASATLQLEDFHLLGESTGGMLAVGFAATHPARLRSLTLCATPKTIGPAAQKLFSFGRDSWQKALLEMGSEGWARELLSRPGTFPSSDPAQIEWAIHQFGRASATSLAGYSTVISTTDITPRLPEVKSRTDSRANSKRRNLHRGTGKHRCGSASIGTRANRWRGPRNLHRSRERVRRGIARFPGRIAIESARIKNSRIA